MEIPASEPAHRKPRSKLDQLRFEFIITELELAVIFGRIALSTRDNGSFRRNFANLQNAYKAAKRSIRAGKFSRAESEGIGKRLFELHALLLRLRRDDS